MASENTGDAEKENRSDAEWVIRPIAKIQNAFTDMFGIPRQSGLLETFRSTIIFEKEFLKEEALRGLDGFSHLWLLWIFSENLQPEKRNKLTVRPPRLGGNVRFGVFATRSPFRPNPIGLSCVKIENIKDGKIEVSGADLLNGTPIIDIKPYLPYADKKENAVGGFADAVLNHQLRVEFPKKEMQKIPESFRASLLEILAEDPRPGYHHLANRLYGFTFADFEIQFRVEQETIYVESVKALKKN